MSSESLPISNPRFAAALKDLSLASLHLKTLEIRNSLAHLAYSNAQLRPFAEGLQPTLDTAATAAAATTSTTTGDGAFEPDPDCVEAIRENEAVMQRMRERIELVRAEVEGRGVSWREFEAPEEMEETEPGVVTAATAAGEEEEEDQRGGSLPLTNGVNGHVGVQEETSSNNARGTGSRATTTGNPWTDGTFQTGVIRNGEVHMDTVPGSRRDGGNVESNEEQRAAVAGSNVGATSVTTTTAPAASSTGGGGGRLTDEELRRLLEQRLAEDDDDEGTEGDGGLHL